MFLKKNFNFSKKIFNFFKKNFHIEKKFFLHFKIIILWTGLFICERDFVGRSFMHLGAGLSVGLSGLAAGFAIGIVGDAGVRGTAQQPRLFVGMILILIFAEVLGLYGLIVALILAVKQ